MSYQKSLKKSTNKKRIRIGSKNYILDTKKFRKFQLNVLAVTASVIFAISAFGVVKDGMKFHNAKTAISFEVADEMIENGYRTVPVDGNWDHRFELLDELEPFELLVYMGGDGSLDVLKYRGYESWDDYAKQEGFKDQYDWYAAQRENVIHPQTKARGGK